MIWGLMYGTFRNFFYEKVAVGVSIFGVAKRCLRLLTDVSKNPAIYIQHVAVNEVRSVGS